MAGNKPHLTLRHGAVSMAIWKNRTAEGKEYCSAKFTKSFKRKDATEYENTDSFGDRDWLSVAFLCQDAARRWGVREFGDMNRPAIGPEAPPAQTYDEEGNPVEEKKPF